MTPSDWQSALQNFLDQNPDLPQGEEPGQESAVVPKRKHKPLQVSVERKGRGGKTATIISGFGDDVTDEEIAALAATLKQRLGTGGSARGGEILIQGDRREALQGLLKEIWR